MYESSPRVVSLAFFALDYALGTLAPGERGQTTIAILEDAEGRRSQYRIPRDEAQGMKARSFIARAGETGEAVVAAVAWNGFLDEQGKQSPAVFVEVSEMGEPGSLVFAQRYHPTGRGRSAAEATLVDTPALLRRESLFSAD